MLDHLATLPLVFPALILSVAFLDVFVNMPLPLYGTLISVIIASSVRYMRLWHALRLHRRAANSSRSGECGDDFGCAARGTVPAHRHAATGGLAVSSWLVVFLLSVQVVSLPLLLVGPGSEVMAVTLFELWQNGQVTELASMGVVWIALMTVVSTAFHMLTRHRQIAA